MNKVILYIYDLIIVFCLFLFALSLGGCSKLIEAPIPSESIADANVYSNDASAIGVLDGIYISMNAPGQPFQGTQSITLLTGLSADELTLYSGLATGSGMYNSYYTNNLTQSLGNTFTGAEFWSPLFNYIFRVNAAIEGIQASKGLTPGIQQQLLGEAKLLRALYYFYLVNLFGDIPLALTTDPEVNSSLVRSPKSTVYMQVIEDLKDAENRLSADYLDGQLLKITTERIRPTKWAAKALLARMYLYMNDWSNADIKASEVINNTSLFSLLPLNSVFLKNSKEAIWQLQPTSINFNTLEGQTLIIPQTGPSGSNPVYLSKILLSSFEPGDQRATYGNWINKTIYKISATKSDTVTYTNKYKLNLLDASITASSGTTNMKEYFMLLRLGEQYLIRAEAKAQQGDIDGARSNVNAVRLRAFSTPQPITVNDKAGILAAIWHERQVELFCEGGHRWLDLKRTGKIDNVMSIVTPTKSSGIVKWRSFQQLYPLPLVSDLQKSTTLTQNDGYN